MFFNNYIFSKMVINQILQIIFLCIYGYMYNVYLNLNVFLTLTHTSDNSCINSFQLSNIFGDYYKVYNLDLYYMWAGSILNNVLIFQFYKWHSLLTLVFFCLYVLHVEEQSLNNSDPGYYGIKKIEMYLSTVAYFFIDGTNTVKASIRYSKSILQLISLSSFGNSKGVQTDDSY